MEKPKTTHTTPSTSQRHNTLPTMQHTTRLHQRHATQQRHTRPHTPPHTRRHRHTRQHTNHMQTMQLQRRRPHRTSKTTQTTTHTHHQLHHITYTQGQGASDTPRSYPSALRYTPPRGCAVFGGFLEVGFYVFSC